MSDLQSARLVASWLLWYPDDELMERLPELREVASELTPSLNAKFTAFMDHLENTPLIELQETYVSVFDMKRKTSLYLTYWTQGDTRNRGNAILKFKQVYQDAGWNIGNEELPDHLAVVLEFAAIGDPVTGDALLAEHDGPINLLHDALVKLESPYADVVATVIETLPELTAEVRERMAEIAAYGPPQEMVGLQSIGIEPYGSRLELTEVRR